MVVVVFDNENGVERDECVLKWLVMVVCLGNGNGMVAKNRSFFLLIFHHYIIGRIKEYGLDVEVDSETC